MKYIVEVPEERVNGLMQAVENLNPGALAAVAVGMDEDDHVVTLGKVEWWYEDEIRQGFEIQGLKPWNSLEEVQRERMAGFLSGFIGIQFEGFGKDGLQECTEQFIRDNPGFLEPAPAGAAE